MSSATTPINTILVARIPDLSSGITAITTQANAHVDVQAIASTALGAVNTGDVITSITVDFVAGLDRTKTDIAHAMLAAGFNVTHDMAFASDVAARSTDIGSIGAAGNSALLAANIAANMSDIAGSINTHVAGISAQVSGAITTAIGAVNGGTINTSANPDSPQ